MPQYIGQAPFSAGEIISVTDPNDPAYPKRVGVPCVVVVSASGASAPSGAAADPTFVQTPMPAGVVTGQVALVASTGSTNRQQLPAAALANGIIVKAAMTNTAAILIGGSGVTTTADGTGTGYPLAPGEAMSFAVANASALYLISSAAGVAYFGGN
jgi:hypothetical protein